ncbi:glycosyltransferase family 2 protein [Larkinella terrae]|uniref:Glycosyltransferase n=1 Tax=Larkinella terrae TaxID=2025311 RepID=A0A7K0EVK9_9BACT|nr:glycosyltransferase family 2 protein [Larkinella terrae]MRS65531.1 glycosyltransferase [Larkinella terrae]
MGTPLLPKVTIVTPSYNQGQFIEATICSVLNQTYPNIEYIVVDGGSTDQTAEVIRIYQNRINRVICEKDRGQSDAINKGFRLASGDLVGWINSDDVLYPGCISRIVELYNQHQDGSIYYSNVLDFINEQGEKIDLFRVNIPNRQHLLNKNYNVIQPGSFYPTRLIRRVGFVNETIHYCMDLDLWLRLLEHGPIYTLNQESIAGCRRWGATKTSTGGRKFLHDIRRVLQHYGATPFAQNHLRIQYYLFKHLMKEKLSMA